MSINIGPAASDDPRPRITVIGVGGAGGNAIANMIDAQIEGVDFIIANTDAQAMQTSAAETRIQLGPDITGGLGAGARPEVGKAAAEETVQEIEDALDGVNMVFIAAGMGGGTGTGAAPVIAEAARRKGVLTVGVVTKPFLFEGTRRMRAADAGIEELQKHVDTLIVIPNQNLFLVAKAETTFKEAFQLADEVLQQGVRSITDLMVMPGLINLDFADVRSVMEEMGKAMMGTGEGEGENRALEAAEQAIANPLLDGVSMQGAKGVIISIIGGEDMKLLEVDEAANHIRELVDEDANIIWGSAFNPELDGRIRVSVVATGIDHQGGGMQPTRPVTLSEARAPKRPVLELPAEDEAEDDGVDEVTLDAPLTLDMPESTSDGAGATYGLDKPEDRTADEEDEPLELGGNLMSAYDAGDEGESDEEYDDVDEIVDPLAGMRNEETERFDAAHEGDGAFGGADADLPDPAADDAHGRAAVPTGFGAEPDDGLSGLGNSGRDDSDDGGEGDTLDLGSEGQALGESDDLLGQADRLAEEDRPIEPQRGRRRGLVSGGGSGESDTSGGGGASSGGGAPAGGEPSVAGSTLFERMANLSRGSGKSEEKAKPEDDDDDEGSSLSIPRFLGGQKNQ